MAVNAELARKVIAHIEANPEEHDQEMWGQATPCGTTLCIAGHALIQSGEYRAVPLTPDDQAVIEAGGLVDLKFVRKEDPDTEIVVVETEARDLLGLTDYQAQSVFMNMVDEYALRNLKMLADGTWSSRHCYDD